MEYILLDCIVINDKIYAVDATWYVVMFDLNLNLLKGIAKPVYGAPSSIVSDGEYLYIAGSVIEVGKSDAQWHVEKKGLDLSLVAKYTSNPSSRSDIA